jgi:hypothetical protein
MHMHVMLMKEGRKRKKAHAEKIVSGGGSKDGMRNYSRNKLCISFQGRACLDQHVCTQI